MSIVLDHLIIRSRDKHRSARFLAELLGILVGPATDPFVPVPINESLTLDFDDREVFAAGHYAFRVDGATFDDLVARLSGSAIQFGAGPGHGWNREVHHFVDGRTVYVRDPDGHSYEFITR